MELPAKVMVYSSLLGLSKTPATLVAIRPDGCFELRLTTQEGRLHTVLLPVGQTGLIFSEPEAEVALVDSIER